MNIQDLKRVNDYLKSITDILIRVEERDVRIPSSEISDYWNSKKKLKLIRPIVENIRDLTERINYYEVLDLKDGAFLKYVEQLKYKRDKLFRSFDFIIDERKDPLGHAGYDIEGAKNADICMLLESHNHVGRGRPMKFKCLFHDENTPSMTVYTNNRFHCFGCQKNGDAIDILMKLEGLTLGDAVAKLIS